MVEGNPVTRGASWKTKVVLDGNIKKDLKDLADLTWDCLGWCHALLNNWDF